MRKQQVVLCSHCDSVVTALFETSMYGGDNGVPIAACPDCGQVLKLRQPHRPDIQRRAI